MEYSNSDVSDSELKMCSKCQQFYGTKATAFMCSKCFKESNSSMQKQDSKFGLMQSNNVTHNSLSDLGFAKAERPAKAFDLKQFEDVEMQITEEEKSK